MYVNLVWCSEFLLQATVLTYQSLLKHDEENMAYSCSCNSVNSIL